MGIIVCNGYEHLVIFITNLILGIKRSKKKQHMLAITKKSSVGWPERNEEVQGLQEREAYWLH